MALSPTIPTILASPGSVLDYGFDLSPPPTSLRQPWLASGEQITNLSITTDAGVTVNSQNIGPNSTGVPAALCTAWLSGFSLGGAYFVHYTFTTNQGRTDTRSIQISCLQR